MKKILLSTLAVVGLLGAFSEAQAGDKGLSMKHGYAVMQAGMGFGHRNYKESAVFALGGGYHLNDYLRSDLTIGMRGWGKIEKEGVKADSWSIPALWNVYARVPWQQMGIYVMGGLGMSYNRMDGTSISKGDDKLSFAWTAGAGFDYRLNDCWGLDLGYRYVDLGEGRSKLKNGHTRLKGDIRSHDVILSARYYF